MSGLSRSVEYPALGSHPLGKPPKQKPRKLKPLGLNAYKVQPPKGQKAFEIETSEDNFKLHMLCVAVAKRGGGKTTATCNLLRNLHKEGSLDRVLAITSTYESNVPQFEGLPLERDDVFHPEDPEAIDKIVGIIEEERVAYDTYWQQMETWQAMRKAMKKVHSDQDILKLDPELLIKAYELQCIDSSPPEHRWNGRKPVIFLLVDDGQGSRLMRDVKFVNFCLRHRHLGAREGDRFGCSVAILCQTYKSRDSGLPKDIRDNCTLLMLFKTQNMKVLDSIAEEVADDVPYEAFMDVYHQAIEGEEHGFLCIDFNPKKHRFRKGFHEYIPDASDPGQPGHNHLRLQPTSGKTLPAHLTAEAPGANRPGSKRTAATGKVNERKRR